MILADTDVLVHAANPSDPRCSVAVNALSKLSQHETLCIAPQTLVEFWGVATRPATKRDGLGMDTAAADQQLDKIYRLFEMLTYAPQLPHVTSHKRNSAVGRK